MNNYVKKTNKNKKYRNKTLFTCVLTFWDL